MNQLNTEDSIWYYVDRGEKQGPCEISRLRDLITSGSIRRDTLIWKEGMADWTPASTIPELAEEFSTRSEEIETNRPPAIPPPLKPYPQTGEGASMTLAQKRHRIVFIVTSGFAVISLGLPWAYIYVSIATLVAMSGVAFGINFWEASVVLILGFGGLAAAITDLAIPTGRQVWRITRWVHLGIYATMTLIAILGVLLPLAHSERILGQHISEYAIPLASIILVGLSITALIMAIQEIRTPALFEGY